MAPPRQADVAMLTLIRLVHALVALVFLGCLALVFYCGLTGRYHPLLIAAMVALAVEGALVWWNGGKCVLAGLHRRYGDDKDFFGLFLPPPVLPYVFPFCFVLTLLGICLCLRLAL